MPLDVYIDGAIAGRRRPGPLAVSLLLHGAAFFLLMNAPEIKLPAQGKSAYKLAIEGQETRLIWYKFNKDLPDVAPLKAKSEPKPVRATVRAKQQIVASRKDAPKREQTIWTPAPELPDKKKFELPNVLAVQLPSVARPFVQPPEIEKPATGVVTPANAPKLEAKAFDPVRLAEISKVAKPFVAPPRIQKQTPSIAAPANAPELQVKPLDSVKLAELSKVTRPFVPPPRRVPAKVAEVSPLSSIPEAPQVEAHVDVPALDDGFKAPPRPFAAPPRAAPGAVRQIALAAPAPSLGSGGAATGSNDLLNANSRELNLAAVGLNPANKANALPANSSPGQFAAGPKIRPDGADSAGSAKGLNVPDLYIGGSKDAKPDLIAQTFAAPTSAVNLRAAEHLSSARPAPPEEETSHSGAVKVSNAPDRRFNGRDVYMMAIQMPNLTSYYGSWLMWYADHTAHEVGLAPIAPPVAHRKVDPKYIAAAASDRIEGKVQLACVIDKEGHVSDIELVRGLDDRLDKSAEEALAKWEFTPATRHGEPVDVDVLVEIPFRLAPVVRKSY